MGLFVGLILIPIKSPNKNPVQEANIKPYKIQSIVIPIYIYDKKFSSFPENGSRPQANLLIKSFF